MIRNDEIPVKRILSWFDLAGKYNVAGNSFFILRGMPVEYAYYEMLHTGEVRQSKDFAKKDFYDAHPMRVLPLNHHITYKDAANFDLLDLGLSPFEQKVLLYSVGKLSVRDIVKRLTKDPGQMDDVVKQTIHSLKRLEKAHFIVYSPY